MKPRYAEGNGKPPIYVASVNRERSGKGAFIFCGEGGEGHKMVFSSSAECLTIFGALMTASVPLSIGGHCIGPADEIALLIRTGELHGSYIEISWSGPETWTVREIGKGAYPWERVDQPSLIANTSFRPDALSRVG